MCTNRFSRYGAYGYADATPRDWSDDDSFGSNAAAKVNWAEVNWATLLQDCLQRNADRYQTIEPREKKIWTLDKRMDSSRTNHIGLICVRDRGPCRAPRLSCAPGWV